MKQSYVKPSVLRLRFTADASVSMMQNCKNFNDSTGSNILPGGTCDNDNNPLDPSPCNVVGS